MIKLFLLLIAAGSGIMILRRKNYNASHKKSTSRLAKHLDASESFEGIAASLDVVVRNKNISADFDPRNLDRVKQLNFTGETAQKYSIASARSNGKGEAVVIANGKGKDIIPTRHGVKEVDRIFACPLYITCNPEQGRMQFYSMFPEDKEHQFFLEDLCDEIFLVVNSE
jgi:hypothetical protein